MRQREFSVWNPSPSAGTPTATAFSPCPGYFPSLPDFKQTFPGSALRPGDCSELFPRSRSRQLFLPCQGSTSHSWAASGAADCLLWLSPFFLCPETMSSMRRRRTAVCRETPHPGLIWSSSQKIKPNLPSFHTTQPSAWDEMEKGLVPHRLVGAARGCFPTTMETRTQIISC